MRIHSKTPLFMAIGFLFSILLMIYHKLTFFEPMDKTSLEAHRIGAFAVVDERLHKDGCYEVGLSSYDNIFSQRKLDGKYKLQVFHDSELLEEKVIDKGVAFGVYSRTDYSNVALHVIEAPFKGHQKLTFKLSVLKPESILKDDSKQVYFYVNKSDITCGKVEAEINKLRELDALTIDTNETNATLLPLSKALWDKDFQKICRLIPKQFGVNTKMAAEHTPLHYAAYLNDVKTTQYLIASGADIDSVDVQGHTPLYYAIDHNATKTVKLLLDKGADPRKVRFLSESERSTSPFSAPRPRKGHPALFYAACNEYCEITELLLKSGKVDKKEMYEGRGVYSYYDLHVLQEYKEEANLDGTGHFKDVKNQNAKKMFSLLEKYGLKYEVAHSKIQFDEEKK